MVSTNVWIYSVAKARTADITKPLKVDWETTKYFHLKKNSHPLFLGCRSAHRMFPYLLDTIHCLLVFPSGFGKDNQLRRVHNQLHIDDTKFVYEPDDIRLEIEGLQEHILGIFDLQIRGPIDATLSSCDRSGCNDLNFVLCLLSMVRSFDSSMEHF
jgi:hypothetical protein